MSSIASTERLGGHELTSIGTRALRAAAMPPGHRQRASYQISAKEVGLDLDTVYEELANLRLVEYYSYAITEKGRALLTKLGIDVPR